MTEKSMRDRFIWLQTPLGFVGLIVWVGSFKASTWFADHNFPSFHMLAAGYVLGFGSAFAGWVGIHIYKGNKSKFIDDHPLFKWISVFTLGVIFLFGLIGVIIDLFGNTNGYFNMAFLIGGLVMGSCTGPMIDDMDRT